MLFNESDTAALKRYISQAIEPLSDADSDVMSDYVLAMLKNDQPAQKLQELCLGQLEDFLGDQTKVFVGQLFNALESRAYLSGSAKLNDTNEDVAVPDVNPLENIEANQQNADNSAIQKRAQRDWPVDNSNTNQQLPQQQQLQQQTNRLGNKPYDRPKNTQPCFSYAQKGYCQRGVNCRYAHIPSMEMPFTENFMVPPMTNFTPPFPQMFPNGLPENALDMNLDMAAAMAQNNKQMEMQPHINPLYAHMFNGMAAHPQIPSSSGSVRGGSNFGPKRNKFMRNRNFNESGDSNSNATNNKTLMIVKVPAESLQENIIRDFFAKFGPVDDVKVEADFSRAFITFNDHESAEAAFKSPSAILDNRFIKVFWKKQHNKPNVPETEELDLEELKKQVEEKQRAHEQKMAEIRERQSQIKAMAQQEQELLNKQLEAQKELSSNLHHASDDAKIELDQRTKALEAELQMLKAEASKLGVRVGPTRGGLSYRRGGYRASYRNVPYYSHQQTAPNPKSFTLDNRPRSISVKLTSQEQAEPFRQYLITLSDTEKIQEQDENILIQFRDRKSAETFYRQASNEIPLVGNVELTWVKNSTPTTTSQQVEDTLVEDAKDHQMDETSNIQEPNEARWR